MTSSQWALSGLKKIEMIKTLIFDLGGVLVSLNRERCLENFSKNLGFDNFGDYLNAYAQKGFFAKYENGDMDSIEFRDEIRKRCTRENVQDEDIDEAFFTFLTHVDPYKVKLLMELKKKYHLLLLSNVNPLGWSKCCELFYDANEIDIEDVFEKLYLSYRVKASKPGKEIYEYLIKDSGINPEEALFIDDSKANIEAGAEMGLNTLYYDVTRNLEEEVTGKLKELGEEW